MALSVSDRLEILDLIARYSQAIDAHDADAWVDCWVADGVFERPPDLRIEGHEGFREYINGPRRPASPTRHWTNNVVIEGDGDEATARAYVATLAADGSATWNTHGQYRDRLRREDGRWKFVYRHLTNEARRTA